MIRLLTLKKKVAKILNLHEFPLGVTYPRDKYTRSCSKTSRISAKPAVTVSYLFAENYQSYFKREIQGINFRERPVQ